METHRKTFVFATMLAVYAWVMALGYSSLDLVQDSQTPLSHHSYQLDDLTDGFHHTVPSSYSDYTSEVSEFNHFPTLDNYIASGYRVDFRLAEDLVKVGPPKAPNSLVNKNKAALLYPFHFFF